MFETTTAFSRTRGSSTACLSAGGASGWDARTKRSELDAGRSCLQKPKVQHDVFAAAYDIATQVIELRLKHGLTQHELAEACGVDQGDISRIERGATSPTAKTLQRIADVLSADVRLVERAS